MIETKFVTAASLEKRYDRHRAAFPRWTKERGFPAPKFLGNRRVWLLSEVEAWEASGGLSSEPAASVRNLLPAPQRKAIPTIELTSKLTSQAQRMAQFLLATLDPEVNFEWPANDETEVREMLNAAGVLS